MVKLPTDKSASESVEDDNRSMANVASPAAKPIYTCPMHPEIQQDHPGNCPKCGMTLIPVSEPPPLPLVIGAPTNNPPSSVTPVGGMTMPDGTVMPEPKN